MHMNENDTPIIRDDRHTRNGELIYPTVPYTYERTAAICKALSTVDALKAVKLVWDHQPLYTTTPEGTRAYVVSSQTIEDLVKANVLEEKDGKYSFPFEIPHEAFTIIDLIVGQSSAFGYFPTPPVLSNQ